MGVSNRGVSPSVGSWKGLGSPKTSLRRVTSIVAVTIATAMTRALVQSYCSLRKTYRKKTSGIHMSSPMVAIVPTVNVSTLPENRL